MGDIEQYEPGSTAHAAAITAFAGAMDGLVLSADAVRKRITEGANIIVVAGTPEDLYKEWHERDEKRRAERTTNAIASFVCSIILMCIIAGFVTALILMYNRV